MDQTRAAPRHRGEYRAIHILQHRRRRGGHALRVGRQTGRRTGHRAPHLAPAIRVHPQQQRPGHVGRGCVPTVHPHSGILRRLAVPQARAHVAGVVLTDGGSILQRPRKFTEGGGRFGQVVAD